MDTGLQRRWAETHYTCCAREIPHFAWRKASFRMTAVGRDGQG
jgi:hypothetical protein